MVTGARYTEQPRPEHNVYTTDVIYVYRCPCSRAHARAVCKESTVKSTQVRVSGGGLRRSTVLNRRDLGSSSIEVLAERSSKRLDCQTNQSIENSEMTRKAPSDVSGRFPPPLPNTLWDTEDSPARAKEREKRMRNEKRQSSHPTKT